MQLSPRTSPLLALVLLAACGPPRGPVFDASAQPMPDFALVDVNPASTRYRTQVSPRDELDRISAWYFGHST
jgi:hypothetical protein